MGNQRMVRRRRRGRGDWRVPVLFATALFFAFPTVTGYSDIGSMLTGADAGAPRWSAHLTAAPAGSIETASMAFADPILTGSTANAAAIDLPGHGQVSLDAKIGTPDPQPDEARVARDTKGGRVVAVTPVAPPGRFSAGSLIDHHVSLLAPVESRSRDMAFARPRIAGKEVAIATAFYPTQAAKPAGGAPSAIAGLFNHNQPDILATAFAEAAPDYARQSPFASILRDQNRQGRFIPPAADGDLAHDWVSTALPASVFTEPQQHCLAAAVYFEARGEPVKGQAAVAQVVLNRVRNPAYPGSICGVVYQNEDWRNRCQFSFACDGVREQVKSTENWQTAEEVAMAVTAGKIWLPEIGASTHYHAVYVHPRWARAMKKVERIGRHIFYETDNGGWD